MPNNPEASVEPAPTRTLGASCLGAEIGVASGVLIGCVDAVESLIKVPRGEWALTIFGIFFLIVPCTAAAGALLGFWLAWAARLGAKRGVWVTSALGAIPLAAFATWVPTSWVREAWQSLSGTSRLAVVATYVVLVGASLVVGRVVHWFVESHRAHAPQLPRWYWPLVAVFTALAAAAYWGDRGILVGLYEDFHYGLAMSFVVATTTAVLLVGKYLQQRVRAQAAVWVKPAGVVLLASACFWVVGASPPSIKKLPALAAGKLVHTLRSLSDVDGDGYSAVLGGTDCAALDGSVAPGKFDIPENKIDEDCSGKDTIWPAQHADNDSGAPDLSGYNVLLISIDALRADHLGAYGYARNTSPAIDAFAKESLVFNRAYSQAPKTFHSMPSLFTGLYPSNLPRDYGRPSLKGQKAYVFYVTSDAKVLGKRLKQENYAVAAFSQLRLFSLQGLDKGVKRFAHTRDLTKRAVSFLNKARQPFFLWLHYLFPHDPYHAHGCCDFGNSDIDRYDSEIAFTDTQVAQVLERLKASGLYEKTIIVITADHGEAFGEHGLKFHPREPYEELLNVPLVVRIPGTAPQQVDTFVELVDVAPTLHSLLRFQGSLQQYDGRSLLSRIAAGPSADDGAYSEITHVGGILAKTIATPNWRLIIDHRRDTIRLFDTSKDRASSVDVAAAHPEVVQRLTELAAARPLRRQAATFSKFAASHDEKEFAESLKTIRQETLLQEALRQLEPHNSERAAAGLKAVAARPGLSAELKDHATRLLRAVK